MASTLAPSSTAVEQGLTARSLGYRYPDGSDALIDLNVTLQAGQVLCLVGDNGAGKSTLLKLCAGRLEPASGTLVWHAGPSDVGYAAQDPELDADMTGEEHLTLWCALNRVPRARRRERLDAVLLTFRLSSFVQERVRSYSGGMKRRLHLALSVLHAPGLWLLDEPTTGLDTETRAALWRETRARAERGGLVIVASHDAQAIERHTDAVLRLEAGRRV